MNIYYLDLVGVSVFAISGSLAAGRKGLDWVGVVTLAVVTSLGGGTIRDVLLNRQSVFWIADTAYLWVAITSAVVTIIYVRFLKPPVNSLLIADALGLALFAIVGAQIAETQIDDPLVVVVMGVLTGVAGGVIRDVLTSEIPLVFRSTEPLYSVAALGGVVLYVVLQNIGVDKESAALFGISLTAIFRFAAIFWKVKLPAVHVSEDKPSANENVR
jgi:uncharacterized membrane protein YeiH